MALSRDKMLELELDATCTRNQFTHDPAPVIAELIAIAGERADLLAKVAGMWAGFFDGEYTHELAEALMRLPGADEWVAFGRERRNAPSHGTHDFHPRA